MSHESLGVAAGDLTSTASSAEKAADQLVSRYQALANEMTALLDGKWAGTSADACRAAWEEWNQGFRLVVMGLHDQAIALQISAGLYESTDADRASAIDIAS